MKFFTKLLYKRDNENLKRLIETKEENVKVLEDGLLIREDKNEILLNLSGETVIYHITLNEDKYNKWEPYTEVFVDEEQGVEIFIRGIEFPSGIDTKILIEAKERFKEMLARNK